jgi:hypothetical protein
MVASLVLQSARTASKTDGFFRHPAVRIIGVISKRTLAIQLPGLACYDAVTVTVSAH